jgi:hypothetical protein
MASSGCIGEQIELTCAAYAFDVVCHHPQELIGFVAKLLYSLTEFPKPLELGVSRHRLQKPTQTNGHEKIVRQRPT